MKRRIISFVLSILVVLSTLILPFNAFADTNYFKDNKNNEYATLAAAVAGVENGGTITMLADYTMPDTERGLEVTKGFTLDGGNHMLTSTSTSTTNAAGYMMNVRLTENQTLTFKNMTWNVFRGFYIYPRGNNTTINTENITATMTGGCFFNLNNEAKGSEYEKIPYEGTIINVKDCSIMEKKKNEPILLLQNDDVTTLNITNSMLKNDCEMGTSTTNNTTLRITATGTKTKVNISKTTMISAFTSSTDNIYASCIAIYKNAGNIDITLDKDTILKFSGTVSKYNQFIHLDSGYTKERNIYDGGATYEATKEIVGFGITLPNVKLCNGNEAIGWKINDVLTRTSGVYTNANAEGNTTFKAYGVQAEDFYMANGASIRLEGPVGLRFTSRVSNALLTSLEGINATVSFKTYFTPTAKLTSTTFENLIKTGVEGTDYVSVERSKWANVSLTGEKQFNAVLYDIPENANGYQFAISAIASITITYNDETTQTFYTTYDATNHSRTMLAVAQAAILGGEGTTYIQSIVDACN